MADPIIDVNTALVAFKLQLGQVLQRLGVDEAKMALYDADHTKLLADEATIAALQGQIQTLLASGAPNSTKIANYDKAIADLVTRATTDEATAGTLATRVAADETAATALGARVTTDETSAAALAARVTADGARLTTAESKEAALETRVGTDETAQAALGSRATADETRIGALEHPVVITPPPPPPPPPVIPSNGTLDAVDNGTIRGWSTKPLNVTFDGQPLTSSAVTPSIARPDVVVAFPTYSPNTGWSVPLPGTIDATSDHTIRAVTTDGFELYRSPWTLHATQTRPPPVAGTMTLYDGPTGVSNVHWNAGLSLAWSNHGGDTQGSVRGTIRTSAGSAASIDATQLVKDLISAGNPGVLFVCRGGDGSFGAPILTVNGAARSVIAFNALYNGNEGVIARTGSVIAAGGSNIAAQHDLSGLSAAAVTSATLALSQSGFGATTYDVFMLKPPTFASNFPIGNRVDYAARGDCIIIDWKPDMSALEGQMAGDTTFGTDPLVGAYATFTYRPGQYEPVALMRRMTTLNQPQWSEGYVGYWLRLEDDGTTLQGWKLGAGIAGRGGSPINANNHLNPVCGNGGNSTDGLYHAPDPTSQDANAKAGYTCGWSMRPWLRERTYDSANPLALYRSPETYAYWSGMPVAQSPYGQNFRWKALITKALWYWIVNHVKINTVANADANGNGVANKDGVFGAWINAVDVSPDSPSSLGWDYTRNLGKPGTTGQGIQLDELPWIDFYEGGTADPVVTCRASLGRIVISKNPIIDPPALPQSATSTNTTSTRPAWLASQPLWTWIAVPNGGFNGYTFPELAAYSAQPTLYGQQQNILDYTGMAKLGAKLYVRGGGSPRSSWFGNEQREFDLSADSPRWRISVLPTDVAQIATSSSQDTNLDGTPVCNHAYNTDVGVPQAGGVVHCGGFNSIPDDRGWHPQVFVLKPGQAQPKTVVATLGNKAAWEGHPVVCDEITGKIYRILAWQIDVLDCITMTETQRWFYKEGRNQMDRSAAAIGNGKLVRIGRNDGSNEAVLDVWTIATGAQVVDRKPVAAPLNDGTAFMNGAALWYQPAATSGAFMAYPDDGNAYIIDETSGTVTQRVIAGQGPAPGAGSASSWGPASRVQAIPQLGVFVVMTKSGMWAVRMAA